MYFVELAWAAFYYELIANYDAPYRKLFARQALLKKLREDPNSVSPSEFVDSVVTFLNEWGGRHIRKEEDVASEMLAALVRLLEKFRALSNIDFTSVDLARCGQSIEEAYDALCRVSWQNRASRTVTLGGTFASKLAHVMNPSLFVMWDNAIRHSACKRGIRTYLGFLQWMQQEARTVMDDFARLGASEDLPTFLSGKLGYDPKKTLAKFLDEYNWVKSQRQLITCRPPEWLLGLGGVETTRG